MMETMIISTSHENWLSEASTCLRAGGVVGFPTDTVYGIGAMLRNKDAVARLYQVKDRSMDKPIPVLISDPGSITAFAEQPSPEVRKVLERFWPGPLTVILNAKPDLPAEVSRDGTVGVRIPDLETTLVLLNAVGPLAVTSANLSGNPSLRSAEGVRDQLEGRIDLLVDGGETPGGMPSTVIDVRGESINVIREGPIRLESILKALTGV